MAREDDDDDDFFASLGIRPIPGDRPSSSRGRSSSGGGKRQEPHSGDTFGDGTFAADASLFQPSPLLWHDLKARLKPAEEHEVATIIGSDIIDRNETLFQEAQAYAQILEDFHSENVALQEAVSRRPRLGATRTHKMLGQQIQLLLGSLHEEELARPTLVQTPRERAVVDFATSGPGGSATPRPLSARSRSGSLTRTSSSRTMSASSHRPGSSRTSASAPDRLKQAMGSINAFNVDTLRSELRAAMDDEAARLKEDVAFLQGLLEEENAVRVETTAQANAPSMPSVSDLRAYENKLQKVLSHQELRVRTESMLSGGVAAPAAAPLAAPASPARTPKLAPLRSGSGSGTGFMPSPPTHARSSTSVLSRSSRTLVRAPSQGSVGPGRPPVAPVSPKLRARAAGAPAGTGARKSARSTAARGTAARDTAARDTAAHGTAPVVPKLLSFDGAQLGSRAGAAAARGAGVPVRATGATASVPRKPKKGRSSGSRARRLRDQVAASRHL